MRFLHGKSAQDGLAVLVLGCALLGHCLYKSATARIRSSWIMSPYLFPTILAGAAILLGVLMLASGVSAGRRAAGQGKAHAPGALRLRDAAAVLALSIAYDLLLTRAGFLVSSALYLAARTAYLGERRVKVWLPVAVLMPLALYALFKLGLGVRLP